MVVRRLVSQIHFTTPPLGSFIGNEGPRRARQTASQLGLLLGVRKH